MGCTCGTGKVLSEPSENDYVSFIKTFVGYNNNKKRKEFDKPQTDMWGSDNSGRTKQLTTSDGQRQSKVAKYRVTFDPRVTARYDIKALIGRGSFSRVVRVEHRTTRRPFAIKMAEVEAPEGRQVCASELAVLRRVRHANVVRLVEVFQTARRVYMVLELATGGELLDRVVAKGHFTERDAARALGMVLDGVAYLHALGIVHRDLKPENLLYYHPGPESRLLVTDFGLASLGAEGDGGGGDGVGGDDVGGDGVGVGGDGVGRDGVGRDGVGRDGVGRDGVGRDGVGGDGVGGDGVGRGGMTNGRGGGEGFGGSGETESAERRSSGGLVAVANWALITTCGTPEYMAPEVVLRRPYTCAVDMWALGVVAYILLSGSVPFEDDSRPRLYRAIVRGKYSFHGEPWPSVSNLAKDFIESLLAPDPASRLTGEQALRHPWVVTRAASCSSAKNLHRSISRNLRRRASRASSSSSRCPSDDVSPASRREIEQTPLESKRGLRGQPDQKEHASARSASSPPGAVRPEGLSPTSAATDPQNHHHHLQPARGTE